jgi:SAM-dependent methyltransferase
MVLDGLSRLLPDGIRSMVPRRMANLLPRGDVVARSLPSYAYLRSLMDGYRVEHLVGVDAASFQGRIEDFLRMRDHRMEGYTDPSKQRDLSIRFHWGHDHDFGSFAVSGSMGDRHLTLLASFIDRLHALPRTLEAKRVLDVGCWTGGTSLILSAMGAEVVAIEEVKKYVDCLRYMKEAFDVKRLEPRNLSLYDCRGDEFDDSFDYVHFSGVLYHVTDPVLALRITFNCLKDGGQCLVESATTHSRKAVLAYAGPTRILGGSEKDLSRTGWNWFVPSTRALAQMMRDVGYVDVRTMRAPGGRSFAVGTREHHSDVMRAGMSTRDVR